MSLCSNRFPLAGSPSTCLLDTVIVPLPSFCLIAVFICLSFRHFKYSKVPGGANVIQKLPYSLWLHPTYMLLVVASLGMTVLEIARLAVQRLGVGLLPVNSVGLLLVLHILWREWRHRTMEMLQLLSAYWLFLFVVEIVKTARLHVLEQTLPEVKGESKYPTSDQVLDNAVLMGLYVLFFCFELITLFLSRRVKPAPFELRGVR